MKHSLTPTFSTDTDLLDLPMIIRYLQEQSYWSRDRSADTIKKAIGNSLCFAAFHDGEQIGFGRAVTDRATYFYLADIFILPAWQNRGIGKHFMQYMLAHPDLQGMRGVLTTQTAHRFYEAFGFSADHAIVRERMMVLPKNGSST